MMKLYNTLTREKDDFKPIQEKEIGIYVCGPTVYDYDHLGQARTWIFFDWLRRYLIAQKFNVKYVQNITDVGHLVNDEDEGEDKIEKKSKTENKGPEEIARYYEAEHIKDLEALNTLKPDYLPRATDYIEEIINYIKVLIEKGFAYQSNGSVYFDVKKLSTYGELSHRNLDDIISGTRVSEDKNKKNSADFALWKAASPEHLQKWSSPWGEGYPGWHIECSVMSAKILGQPFDIHGSAIEHIFPHHENEIAQSKAYAGKSLANYFLHSGMLNINGQKMGKSLGNYITVKDAVEKYGPDIIKLAFMQTFWRKPFDWEENAILSAQKMRDKLVRAKMNPKDGSSDFREKLNSILDDDFNTPQVLTLINEYLTILTKDDFEYLENIFGLELLENKGKLTDKQREMIKQRVEMREKGDYDGADKIRKELEKEGIILEDTAKGTKILS